MLPFILENKARRRIGAPYCPCVVYSLHLVGTNGRGIKLVAMKASSFRNFLFCIISNKNLKDAKLYAVGVALAPLSSKILNDVRNISQNVWNTCLGNTFVEQKTIIFFEAPNF
jgi:hypothetical protein